MKGRNSPSIATSSGPATPAAMKSSFQPCAMATQIANDRLRLGVVEPELPGVGGRVLERRIAPMVADADRLAAQGAGRDLGHEVERRREAKAVAEVHDRVVAQMVIGVPDDDVEDHPQEQLARIVARRRTVAADPRREVGIAAVAVVALVQPKQGQSAQRCARAKPSAACGGRSARHQQRPAADLDELVVGHSNPQRAARLRVACSQRVIAWRRPWRGTSPPRDRRRALPSPWAACRRGSRSLRRAA